MNALDVMVLQLFSYFFFALVINYIKMLRMSSLSELECYS